MISPANEADELIGSHVSWREPSEEVRAAYDQRWSRAPADRRIRGGFPNVDGRGRSGIAPSRPSAPGPRAR